MSLDLFNDETAQDVGRYPLVQNPPAGTFEGFFRGAGMATMRSLAQVPRAVDLAGAVAPIIKDAFTGGTTAQDKYFQEHDSVFSSPVDYWTPRPNEVGAAGNILGSAVGMGLQFAISPALAIGTAGLGSGEDLVNQGVSGGRAALAGGVNALATGLGLYMPILGQTLAQRIGTGVVSNMVFGGTARGVNELLLNGTPASEGQPGVFDPASMTLDALMGAAFGGITHINPEAANHSAKAWAEVKNWAQNLSPTEKAAIATLREAQHLNTDSAPGQPVTPGDLDAHVQRMRQAMDQLSTGQPVSVQDIKVPAPEKAGDAPPAVTAEGQNLQATPGAEPQFHPHPAREEASREIAAVLQNEALFLYHGSPHDFDAFSTDKIGTGEGVQAFGHGLYFAENADVAGNYRKSVSEKTFIEKVRDSYDENDRPQEAEQALQSNPDLSAAEKNLLTALKADDYLGFDYPHQAVRAALREPENFDLSPETKAALAQFGNTYKVRITADKQNFLDHDKPLSEQPGITAKLDAAGIEYKRDWTGAQLYESSKLVPGEFRDKVAASAKLREAGIEGVQYLDRASRKEGSGTHNYVLFDASKAHIIEKNGKAVAAPFPEPSTEAPPAEAGSSGPPPPPGGVGGTPAGAEVHGIEHPEIQAIVQHMANEETGWAQVGGKLLREGEGEGLQQGTGKVIGRTEWIPKADWWPARPDKRMNAEKVQEAVRKAIAGEPLKPNEQRTVDFMVHEANLERQGYDEVGGEPEYHALADDALDHGLAPSPETIADLDLTARAAKLDEGAVERAAMQFADDDAGFRGAMKAILDEHAEKQGAEAGGRGAAGEPAPGGAGPKRAGGAASDTSAASRPGATGDDSGATGDGTGAPASPVAIQADRVIAARPDLQLTLSTPDGGKQLVSAREYLDAERAAAAQMREDTSLFQAAAECLLGGG